MHVLSSEQKDDKIVTRYDCNTNEEFVHVTVIKKKS